MENSIIKSLVTGAELALKQSFSEAYVIYKDNVAVNTQMPGLYIQIQSASEHKQLAERYLRKQKLCVTLVPKKDSLLELYPISEQLENCLEIITMDGVSVRASNKSSKIENGLLIFTADYNFRIIKQYGQMETMEKLKMEGRMENVR